MTATIFTSVYADTPTIPQWIKNNAKWWSQGQLADGDFEKGIEYLIDQKIIPIPSQNQTTSGAQQVPTWVKNIAGMWADGKISDNDFLKGVGYLVQIGLIQIHSSAPAIINTMPTIPMSSSAMPLVNSTTQSTSALSANTLKSTTITNA
ncbi:MAG: hypothetical protein KGI28_10080, partial [Thaumarchaeota archaeon]|nr:hypothetical protein [Nitrososphaerota archaeon]